MKRLEEWVVSRQAICLTPSGETFAAQIRNALNPIFESFEAQGFDKYDLQKIAKDVIYGQTQSIYEDEKVETHI